MAFWARHWLQPAEMCCLKFTSKFYAIIRQLTHDVGFICQSSSVVLIQWFPQFHSLQWLHWIIVAGLISGSPQMEWSPSSLLTIFVAFLYSLHTLYSPVVRSKQEIFIDFSSVWIGLNAARHASFNGSTLWNNVTKPFHSVLFHKIMTTSITANKLCCHAYELAQKEIF